MIKNAPLRGICTGTEEEKEKRRSVERRNVHARIDRESAEMKNSKNSAS